MDEEESEDDDEEAKDENEGQLSNKISIGKQAAGAKEEAGWAAFDTKKAPKFAAEGLMKLKKANKMREKKEKKARKRADKLGDELSHNMEAAFEGL